MSKKELPEKYLSPYDPAVYEDPLYKTWEESGFFNPDNLPGERTETYSIVMPPPNANGRLHAGHALDFTLKDILGRFYRMRGKQVLLVPGADHAGFETQGVYEKKLQKEGRSRFGMERQELYDEIYEFVMSSKHIMEADVKKLGISCDWSRNTFTLDESVVSRVQDTFIKMYQDGLIYRGKRCVHWNPKFKTSLSDIETTFEDRKEPFYYFQYGPFVIGTSRPETKFADKYIVVHPDDKRYAQYEHMQEFEVEWINGPIKATLIKDEVADMELGSGAMTITPWHSQVDFDLAKKYDLPMEQIIDWDGKLLPVAGEFAGTKIHIARPDIVKKLEEKGLVVKIDEAYEHAVRLCERTGVVIEPQVKDQWFVKMDGWAKNVLDALDSKDVNILTSAHEKVLRNWMENSIDWNISRQIVWGIQIPAWFRTLDNGEIESIASKERPEGDGWEQDSDTFDTWFSSGQWPLMTLGYPDGNDMEYYPTNVMETGTELIFKWVPRMIMFGMYLDGRVPFKDVYLHGMILDKHGKKMSKSKGNVISPIEVADTLGMDALRMALVVANPPGTDSPLSLEKIGAYKKFANKMWNVARFVYTNTTDIDADMYEKFVAADSWNDDERALIDAWNSTKDEIAGDIENYRIYLAAEKLYHYVWDTFANDVMESTKASVDPDTRLITDENKKYMLLHIFEGILKTAHPFMPFITEEIWKDFPKKDKGLLMVEEW